MSPLDRLPDYGLLALIHGLREDFTRTGDVWYAEEAEKIWAELELRQQRAV